MLTCPHCRRKITIEDLARLSPDELRTLWGQYRVSQRASTSGGARPGAGRPRSSATRCKCGLMTLARAKARGPSTEHKPDCNFYPAP